MCESKSVKKFCCISRVTKMFDLGKPALYPFLLSEALFAANQLKTMRRHPGISPEGGRRCGCTRERPNSGPELFRCCWVLTSAHKLLCWYLDKPCRPKIPISTFLWEKTGPLSPESRPSSFWPIWSSSQIISEDAVFNFQEFCPTRNKFLSMTFRSEYFVWVETYQDRVLL